LRHDSAGAATMPAVRIKSFKDRGFCAGDAVFPRRRVARFPPVTASPPLLR
jgi:hypothetical protein